MSYRKVQYKVNIMTIMNYYGIISHYINLTVFAMTQYAASSEPLFPSFGENLRKARKKAFPNDTMAAFATRCEIGLSTY